MSASSCSCLAASHAPVCRVGATTLGCHDHWYSMPTLVPEYLAAVHICPHASLAASHAV